MSSPGFTVRLRCFSVVYGQAPVEGRPGMTVQTSETASFGDESVPLHVLVNRKCCVHIHTNEDPENFGHYEVGKVYAFKVEPCP